MLQDVSVQVDWRTIQNWTNVWHLFIQTCNIIILKLSKDLTCNNLGVRDKYVMNI